MNTSPAASKARCFQFGPYVVDGRRRLLWRDGSLVPLTSKALQILELLVRNHARVVSKEELLEQLWPDTAVGENTLTRHISTLRKALEERPAAHHYIVTVPGHGYQFVADVTELDECPPEFLHTVGLPVASHGENGASPEMPESPAGALADLPALAERDEVPHELPPEVSNVEVGALSAAPVPVRSRWSSTRNNLAVVAIGAACAAIAVVLFVPLSRLPELRTNRILRQVTFNSGLQRAPTWSPDGKSIAYSSDRSGTSAIWVQTLADPTPRRVTSMSDDESQPDWSADGEWLVFRSERDGGGLYVVPARGGIGRRIANSGYQPRWSPDGSLVLFSSSGHEGGTPKMYIVGLDGSVPQAVRPDLMAGLRGLYVDWKPGTRQISIWGRGAESRWTFLTAPVLGGPAVTSEISNDIRKQIAAAGVSLTRFRWSASGRHLFFEGRSQQVNNLWRVTVDPSTLAWVGGPERLTTGTSDDTEMALSADGTRLLFSARHAQTRLWSFPFDPVAGQLKGAGQPVTSGGAGEQDADTPADGSKLVYRAVRGGRQELWERSLVDGRERLLISSTGWNRTRPRWSPDGTRIAYSRSRADANGGRAEPAVAILPASGGSEHLLTKPGDIEMVPTDWSPDGQWLLGTCRTDPAETLGTCLMPSSGSPAQPSAQVVASDPTKNMFEQRFSPDQHWISFIAVDATDAGVSTIFVIPAAGGRWTAITAGQSYDDKPHWAPDGRTLYFISNRQGLFNVWGSRFDGASGTPAGAPFRVTAFNTPQQTISAQLGPMQIAVTSQRLFLPITQTSGELWMLEGVDR
jgi:Tol biopolymer transport system component/DNA-binding winged helix-turn-helix (wHTH) protein